MLLAYRAVRNCSRSCGAGAVIFSQFSSQRGIGRAEEVEDDHPYPYGDVPRPAPPWRRKPYVTPVKILIKRAKKEKDIRKANPCRVLEHPPENGLLVPRLVPVAHTVYHARESLLRDLAKLAGRDGGIPVKKFCSELHIGDAGHEIRSCYGPKCSSRNSAHVWIEGSVKDVVGFPYCYHLLDRALKPRVIHKEKYDVPRLPAVVELCIQAGLDLEAFPTKRRTRPVYSVEGRIAEFNLDEDAQNSSPCSPPCIATVDEPDDITIAELSARTLRSWLEMRSGAMRLMRKYAVLTCGYCPEVQVGPKGHKVRMCRASKHQQRDGQHAWQEASVDDVIQPKYVWHVWDPSGPALANELKRYYGKAPAIVEMCVRAGAPVPPEYRSMMRLDVVPPDRDERDLVA